MTQTVKTVDTVVRSSSSTSTTVKPPSQTNSPTTIPPDNTHTALTVESQSEHYPTTLRLLLLSTEEEQEEGGENIQVGQIPHAEETAISLNHDNTTTAATAELVHSNHHHHQHINNSHHEPLMISPDAVRITSMIDVSQVVRTRQSPPQQQQQSPPIIPQEATASNSPSIVVQSQLPAQPQPQQQASVNVSERGTNRKRNHERVLSDLLHHFNESDMESEEFRKKFGISSTRITKFSALNSQHFLFSGNSAMMGGGSVGGGSRSTNRTYSSSFYDSTMTDCDEEEEDYEDEYEEEEDDEDECDVEANLANESVPRINFDEDEDNDEVEDLEEEEDDVDDEIVEDLEDNTNVDGLVPEQKVTVSSAVVNQRETGNGGTTRIPNAFNSRANRNSSQVPRDQLTMVVIHKPFELIRKESPHPQQNNVMGNEANGFIKILERSKLKLSSIEPQTRLRPLRVKASKKNSVIEYDEEEFDIHEKLRQYYYHYYANVYADRFMYSAEQMQSTIHTPSQNNTIIRNLLRPHTDQHRRVKVISQYVFNPNIVENYKKQTMKWITGIAEHPHIVRYLDFEVDYVVNTAYNESYYVFWIIVEDLLESMMTKFLASSRESGGKCFVYTMLLDWMIQLASALSHLHNHDVLHGNLQMDAIFVKNNLIKLGNFQFMPNNPLETQASNQPFSDEDLRVPHPKINRPPLPRDTTDFEGDWSYDKRSEVFSFGVLLLSICTLRKSVAPLVSAFWNRDTVYISQVYNCVKQNYTKQLEGVLSRCCEMDPSKRPTMAELVVNLEHLKTLYSSNRSKSKSKSSTSFVDKIKQDMFEAEYGDMSSYLSYDMAGSSTSETKQNRKLAVPLPICAPDGPAYASTLLGCGKTVKNYVMEKYGKNRYAISRVGKLSKQGNKSFLKIKVVKASNAMSFKGKPQDNNDSMNASTISSSLQATREFELLQMRSSIQNYEVDELINAGSQGRVYLAREKKTNKFCAIKRIELKDHRSIHTAGREISIMYDMAEKNAGFIKIWNWFINTEAHSIYSGIGDRDSWYMNIVLEYASGGDLRSIVSQHRLMKKSIKTSTITKWLKQICASLQVMHQQKLIHRDLKPGNIFLVSKDEQEPSSETRPNHKARHARQQLDSLRSIPLDDLNAKIGDLGLALRTDELTRENNAHGTEVYKPPEAHDGKRYNTAFDIWSLGCLAMELITLEELVNYRLKIKNNPQYIQKKLNSLHHLIDDRLAVFCSKCLQPEPSDRPSAQELLQLLAIEEVVPLTDTDELASLGEHEKDMIEDIEETQTVQQLLSTDCPTPNATPRGSHTPRDPRRVTKDAFTDFILDQIEADEKVSEDKPLDNHPSSTSSSELQTEVSIDQQFPSLLPVHREKLHQLLVKRVDTWTESDVGVWLTTIDFARYVELFRSQEIDGSALLILDKAELEKIGVTKVGPKVKLWNAIETLRQINQKM